MQPILCVCVCVTERSAAVHGPLWVFVSWSSASALSSVCASCCNHLHQLCLSALNQAHLVVVTSTPVQPSASGGLLLFFLYLYKKSGLIVTFDP